MNHCRGARHRDKVSALPTNQIQSNKLPNKSIKCAKILFQIKQMKNTGFEITFDIFDTGYKVGDMACRADERVFAAYPEPDDAKSWRADLTNQSRYPDPPLVNYTR